MTLRQHRDPRDPRDPRASTLLAPSTSYAAGDFVLLGLPFDASIPTRGGAKMGPQAFREALPSLTTFGNGVDLSGRVVRDLGDLDLPPESIREAHDRVQAAARDIFAAGAPYRRALETGICHGSRTFILGTRDFANSAYYDRWVREQGITTIPVDRFDLSPAHAIASDIRSKLEAFSDAIFLSIDMDAAELPGSSAAAPGTLSSREMIAVVRAIAASPRLIGCDLSELSPPWDVGGFTAKLAARLFLEVFASRK